jgi:two-component system NtrC family sensor kinase
MELVYRKYALGAAGALALAAMLAVALSQALTRHLGALREGVEAFAQRRPGSGKIAIRSGDEIEALAITFNSMADSLMEYSRSLEMKVEERTEKIKEVERKLMQAEKLAAIGFLGAGVAHEINNPISVVVTRLELIRRSLAKGEIGKAQKDLEVVLRHAQRIGKIAGNLLTFSRNKPGDMGPVNLNESVMSVVDLIEYPIVTKGIRLALELGGALPMAWANAAGMEQVIYNIIYNAYQALGSGGVITVSTKKAGADALEMEISDNGPGIPPEILSHIFEPFFTTKEVGRGSGLGLSISYGLVRDFGGAIEVHSLPGAGAAFTVRLRLAAGAMRRSGLEAGADAR